MNKEFIESMSYTEFIALLKETNRCPGGKKTIRRIREILNIDKKTKILEVGSNTGFTSLEFARISPARLYGIDISKECVDVANEHKNEDIADIRKRVSFLVGSSYDIPFKKESFDIIMAGGATGFMDDKSKALSEYFRTLKDWGFLVMTQLVYHTEPPQQMIESISKILGTKIKPMRAVDWKKKVTEESPLWELYFQESNTLSSKTDSEISDYISYFMNKDHVKEFNAELREAIEKRWEQSIKVFNENHKYLGYVIQIYRKRNKEEEPELFV